MKAALVGALVLSLAVAATARAAEEDPDTRARALFAIGNYQQAMEIYGKLYADTLHPTYLRNVGRCHQMMGDPDKAINSFREYLRKSKSVPAEERAEVNGFIKEMEALKEKREAERAQAAPPRSRTPVDMPPDMVARTESTPAPPREPRQHTGLALGLVIGGVAMAAAGSVLMAVQASKADEARQRRDTAAYDNAKGPWMVGLGGAIGGALAITGGIVLLLVDGDDSTSTALRVDPWIGRDGGGLLVGAGF